MRTVKVLSLSTLYPNAAQPRHGIFLRHRLAHLARVEGMALQIVAPVPWFPLSHPLFGRYGVYARAPHEGSENGIAIHYPRYPVLPKIGMTVAPSLMAAALLPKLRAIQKSGFNFDIIDSYYLYPDGVAAALLGMLLKRPVLLTAFGTDVSLVPNYALPRAQILWAIRQSKGVTSVCEALRTRLIELGADGAKIRTILHGVDLDMFRPPTDRAALRHQLGFDGPTIISIGHLIERKGHNFAISAIAQMPGTTLVIAGDGPEEAALRKLADDLHVSDRVRFLGHVDQSGVPGLLGAADALVLCSDREGIANVLMEALACGTPVAATPIWGSPEVLNTPDAGILLKARSVDATVEGLRKLLSDPPDRGATRRYVERYSWDDTAAQHAAMIRSAVGDV